MTGSKSLGLSSASTNMRSSGTHVSLSPHAPWCRKHLDGDEVDSCRGNTVAVGPVETALVEADDRLRPLILITHRDWDTGVLQSHEFLTIRQTLELADRLHWLASEALTTFEAVEGVPRAGRLEGEWGGSSR